MHPADAISSARQRRNLSRQELADVAGVTERAVEYWESGQRSPKVVSMLKIAAALDVTFTLDPTGEVEWRAVQK
jgi:transcriptional regulator with XRE-family HTH domain